MAEKEERTPQVEVVKLDYPGGRMTVSLLKPEEMTDEDRMYFQERLDSLKGLTTMVEVKGYNLAGPEPYWIEWRTLNEEERRIQELKEHERIVEEKVEEYMAEHGEALDAFNKTLENLQNIQKTDSLRRLSRRMH